MNPILLAKYFPCGTGNPFSRSVAILTLGLVVLAISSVSCSTTRGFGQDVEKTGDKIQEAASR